MGSELTGTFDKARQDEPDMWEQCFPGLRGRIDKLGKELPELTAKFEGEAAELGRYEIIAKAQLALHGIVDYFDKWAEGEKVSGPVKDFIDSLANDALDVVDDLGPRTAGQIASDTVAHLSPFK